MTLGSSVVVLLLGVAAIGLVAFLCLALKVPRRKRETHKRVASAPLADPPTITHYGHA